MANMWDLWMVVSMALSKAAGSKAAPTWGLGRQRLRRHGLRCQCLRCQCLRWQCLRLGRQGPRQDLASAVRLCIGGTASRGFSFRHADGTTYGHCLNPPSLDVAQQAFSALTHMGFRPTEARALVDAVVHAGPPEELAQFVHAALRCS